MTGGAMAQLSEVMIKGPWISMTGSQKMGNLLAKPNKQDLAFIKELLEAGKVKPVIDRYYPLDEVADAFRYLEEGHARGKVVITVHQVETDKSLHVPLAIPVHLTAAGEPVH
jgi:NADPH:quinone reductase-like Zn-dependent oxidoreductase